MLKRPNIKRKDMVLVDGTWYHVDEIDADGCIWASDDDGGEREVAWEAIDAIDPYEHIIDYD